MRPQHRIAVQFAVLVALVLAGIGWALQPLAEAPASAEPVAQAQPTTRARPTHTPVPTLTAEQKERKIQDLQQQKLETEISLLERQDERLKLQRDTEKQAWRAPAEVIAAIGPTLVGLGLLYLLARALNYWIPPEPARETAPDDEEEEL